MVALGTSASDYREERVTRKNAQRVLLIFLETFANLASRAHVTGTIKQTSLILERKVRNIIAVLLKSILLRNPIITINGVRYYMSDARLESLVTLSSDYEKNVWDYLNPVIGDVFIDIGAHVGKYALRAAKLVGQNGLVIAVEPHPENFQALLKGIELNGFENVLAINVAAWNEECKLKLFLHDAAVYHSAKIDLGLGYVEVEGRRIDSVVKELGVEQVNWIKIDVEGAEIEVLRGLEKTISRYAPKLIIETQWRNFKEVFEFLENHHYTAKPIIEEQDPKAKWGYFYCEPRPTVTRKAE